jgi:cellulose synthase/poly-beta-1,6-N-acetylglucosamine synthase-like glycosyltransferase
MQQSQAKIKVSVIIQVFNAQKIIDDCIQALLNQDYQDSYEIIAVDDGSTDHTVEVMSRHPIRVVTQKNAGPARARNHGASLAKGEFLLFTDSDCVVDPAWIRLMVAPLEQDATIAGVQGRYRTKQPSAVAKFCQIEIEERYEIIRRHENIQLIGTYAAAYRAEIFAAHKGFDELFPVACAEDADLSFRMVKNGHRLVFQEGAIVYHQHPPTLKKYWKQKFNRGYWRTVLYRRNPSQIIHDDYTPQGLKLQVMLVPLMIAALVAMIWSPVALPIFVGLVLLNVLLSWRLLRRIIQQMPNIFGMSLVLLFVRTAAIFYGLVVGFFDNYLLKPIQMKPVQS